MSLKGKTITDSITETMDLIVSIIVSLGLTEQNIDI